MHYLQGTILDTEQNTAGRLIMAATEKYRNTNLQKAPEGTTNTKHFSNKLTLYFRSNTGN